LSVPPETIRRPCACSGEHPGVAQNIALVLFEIFAQRFAEGYGLGRYDVYERAALHARKEFAINFGRVLFAAEDETAARAAQRLVRGRRHVIGVRHGRGMKAGGDGPGDVRYVCEHASADRACDFAYALEVYDARVGARAADDEPRLVLLCDAL
jgi:hypothetical protein